MEGKMVLGGFLVTGSCHLDFQGPPRSQNRLAEEKETGFKHETHFQSEVSHSLLFITLTLCPLK